MFVELVVDSKDLTAAGISSRDELEDPIQDALILANLGEVTGGGSGLGKATLDIEVHGRFDEALALIKGVLKSLNVSRFEVQAA